MKNVYLDINPIPRSLLDEIEKNSFAQGELNSEQRNLAQLARCGAGVGIDLSHLKPLSDETRSIVIKALGCLETTKRDKT